MNEEIPEHAHVLSTARPEAKKLLFETLARFPHSGGRVAAAEECPVEPDQFWPTFTVMQVAAGVVRFVRQIIDRTGSGGAELSGVLPCF